VREHPSLYLRKEEFTVTEREKSNIIREKILKEVKKYFEDQDLICERILSPSSLILFTEDNENNERYVEVKFIVRKPEYTPDDDIENFKAEIQARAVKQVKANLNKMNKKDRAIAEREADKEVQKIIDSYK
jgi:hypothetical protein